MIGGRGGQSVARDYSYERLLGAKAKRWTKHGSTVWLWEPNKVHKAVDYVVLRRFAASFSVPNRLVMPLKYQKLPQHMSYGR